MKLKVSQTISNGVEVEKKVAVCRVSPFDTGVGAVQLSTITAKGDLFAGTASATVDNVAAGADGTFLQADSTQATGMKWGTPSITVPLIVGGRLTLETGVPVSTTDQAAKTTLYYTPFKSNQLPLYYNSTFNAHTFSELSVSLAGRTASKPHDCFIFLEGSTVKFGIVAWTDATTRATAIAMVSGVYVNNAAFTPLAISGGGIPVEVAKYSGLYVGTMCTTGTEGQCEDSVLNRLLFSAYNPVQRPFKITDTTDSWAYTTTAWRPWNNSTAHRATFVQGLNEEPVNLTFWAMGTTTSAAGKSGIGLDKVNGVDGIFGYCFVYNNSVMYNDFTGIGLHYLQLMEYGGSGASFYGDNGGALQSGARGWIWA